MSGQGGKFLAGFVVLHVLCCGLPLLVAAGAFAGAGAVLGNTVLVAAGAGGLAVLIALALRRARRSRNAAPCCAPTEESDRLTGSSAR